MSRALDSVRAQTRAADEVIVVDDGSSDGTAEMLAAAQDLILLQQPNQGVSAARNNGISRARSTWIAFLDSDDEWLPDKLETQLKQIEQDASVRLCHCDEIWIRNGRRINPARKHKKAGGWIYPKCLPLCAISPSAVMIHRSVFDEIGYFDTTLPACEDYDLWLRICARWPVTFIDQPLLVKYGGHEDQLSARYPGMDRFRIRALEKILRQANLCEQWYQQTTETLSSKTGIYLNGMLKREKYAEAEKLLTEIGDLLPADVLSKYTRLILERDGR